MTLIELLVVIVIITTLVGGVIPVLSPNNDTRKIRVAARGLQGYINLVQAQAAHTGRPQGIAFRESSADSGVSLEVFGLEVLPPFAGFSTESRVQVVTLPSTPTRYNAGDFPQLNNSPLYTLNLLLAIGGVPDALPPRSFRIGDVIDVEGNFFQVVDTAANRSNNDIVGTAPNQIEYLGNAGSPKSQLQCVWINSNGQVAPQGLKRYKINRQPTSSSESPYQLPAGIAIDMQASVTEGNGDTTRFPVNESLSRKATGVTDTVGIMFSPTGAVSSVIFNGNVLTSVSRIVLLLGRIENGGIDPTLTLNPWEFSNVNDAEELKQKQSEINWLNLDSRLLSIVTSNGRAVVSETAFVDPSTMGNPNSASEQIEAAHDFAHEMSTGK